MFHGTKDEIFKYVNEQSLSFYGFVKKESTYQTIDKIFETVCFYRPACPFKKLGRPSFAVLLHSDTKESIEMPMSIVGVNTSMNVGERERAKYRQASEKYQRSIALTL